VRRGRVDGRDTSSADRPFQLSFNSSLRVDFQGARVTSDGGLILARELDERLGLSALVERPREPLPLATMPTPPERAETIQN